MLNILLQIFTFLVIICRLLAFVVIVSIYSLSGLCICSDITNSCFSGHRHYKIVSSLENYTAIVAKLREEGIAFETDSGYELIPITPVEVTDSEFILYRHSSFNILY